jgi:hypothetical protein
LFTLSIQSEIFPNHRPGSQEDAHEMLTLLLGALEPLPPKTAAVGGKPQEVQAAHQVAARPPFGPPAPPLKQSRLSAATGIDHQSQAPTPIEEVFGGRLKNESIIFSCFIIFIIGSNQEKMQKKIIGNF